MDTEVEMCAKECEVCSLKQKAVTKSYSSFFKLYGRNYFIFVDDYSKWIEVKRMKKSDARKVKMALAQIFAFLGLPNTLVSDNGPPFSSWELTKFLKANGVKFMHWPPYTPESNGLAEKAVSTAKASLKPMLKNKKKKFFIEMELQKFLLKYRNTPSTVTDKTPNEMLFRFKPKTLLEKLKPPIKSPRKISNSEEKFRPPKIYQEGEKVLLKQQKSGENVPSRILKAIGRDTYLVNSNNKVKMAHHNQLRRSFLDANKHPGIVIVQDESTNVQPTVSTSASASEAQFQSSNSGSPQKSSGNGEAVTSSPKIRRSARIKNQATPVYFPRRKKNLIEEKFGIKKGRN
jgi:hypothetical protein